MLPEKPQKNSRATRPDNRRPSVKSNHGAEATAFLLQIINAADALRAAKTFTGDPALYLGPRWRLLRALERCGGAPTLADLGRLLKMSRQGAREPALALVERGLVLHVIRLRLEGYARDLSEASARR